MLIGDEIGGIYRWDIRLNTKEAVSVRRILCLLKHDLLLGNFSFQRIKDLLLAFEVFQLIKKEL